MFNMMAGACSSCTRAYWTGLLCDILPPIRVNKPSLVFTWWPTPALDDSTVVEVTMKRI